MPYSSRLIAVAVGVILPLAATAAAEAAPRHVRHHPAHVMTATYKPRHRHAPVIHTVTHARVHHHSGLRGS